MSKTVPSVGAHTELPKITKGEWKKRYKAQLIKTAGITKKFAEEVYQAGTEDHDFNDDPEDAALMELSYWNDQPRLRGEKMEEKYSAQDIHNIFNKKRNKIAILFEALDFMQAYNGRSVTERVALAMGYSNDARFDKLYIKDQSALLFLGERKSMDFNKIEADYQIEGLEKEIAQLKEIKKELIEALDAASSVFDDMDSISWNDDSGWQHSSYEYTQDFVNEILEKHSTSTADKKGKT